MKFTFVNYLSNVKIWAGCFFLQAFSPVNAFVTKYIFSDFKFLIWLAIAMMVDLVTGITKVWNRHGFKAVTSRGLRDTITKCIQYGAFLIITNLLTHYEINGSTPTQQLQWLNKIAYEFLLLIEIKSVYENIVSINPKLDIFKEVMNKIAKLLPRKDEKE